MDDDQAKRNWPRGGGTVYYVGERPEAGGATAPAPAVAYNDWMMETYEGKPKKRRIRALKGIR